VVSAQIRDVGSSGLRPDLRRKPSAVLELISPRPSNSKLPFGKFGTEGQKRLVIFFQSLLGTLGVQTDYRILAGGAGYVSNTAFHRGLSCFPKWTMCVGLERNRLLTFPTH
jgi:hypothetical protein